MIHQRHLFVACVLILIVISPLRSSVMASPFAQPDTTVRTPDPRTALLLGLIPGGGQLYNRKWVKAALIMAMDGYAITQFQQSRELFSDYHDLHPDAVNPYMDRRNRNAWRIMLFYLLGVLDGYVDAHLSTFPPDTLYQELPSPDSLNEENR
ncbi:DUF5683 domain-containing protein [Candidatus Neomarinimicrobiota bacterium]